MRESEFIGKFDPEKLPEIKRHVEEDLEDSGEPLDGELEKTPEQLVLLNAVSNYIQDDAKKLGIDLPAIDPNRVHFLPDEVYRKNFPDIVNAAFYNDQLKAFFIHADRLKGTQLIHALVHEAVHSFSKSKIYVSNEGYNVTRVGYGVSHPTEKNHEHFTGLNEAVVDFTSAMIMDKYKFEFSEQLHLKDEDWDKVRFYNDEIEVLKTVMRKVADIESAELNKVWDSFRRAQYTGELMHLRKIEKIFGKGALRILAIMGSRDDGPVSPKTILKYFQTDDPEERLRIVEEVLPPRERRAYDKRNFESN